MRVLSYTLLLAASLQMAYAEDWSTTDGKTYRDVKVVKVDDDAVTILDSDGGALVPLATLPPDLQKQFHFNSDKARIAAAKRMADDQASDDAIAQQQKAEAAKIGRATPPVNPSPSTWTTPTPLTNAPTSSVPPSLPGTIAATPPSTTTPSSQFSLNRGDASSANASHQHVNPDWKLVWSDEFDGSTIDTSKWNFDIDGKGEGNNEMEYYSDQPENAHVENGHLLITAIKDGTDAEGKKHKFTSARLNTKGKFNWLYGRFEARIKMPTGRGVWPAFWMMPEDSVYGGWASSGEMDIVEEVGHEPNMAYGTIHYGGKWPRNTHTGDKFILPSGNLCDDWHVYALEWEKGELRWYIDGQLYQTQTNWRTDAAPFPAPFDQKFFIILNFAVGGAWPGKPSPDTPFPQTMDVDYVRVYQPATN
jgi:beta-glucanase (GH16 family)